MVYAIRLPAASAGLSMPPSSPPSTATWQADDMVPDSPVLVEGHRMGVRRFGSVGGWPLMWCHGGLSSGLDAKFFDAAGWRCGADIFAIDRPGIGRSEAWGMSSITHWPHMVEQVADLLGLDDFAVAGWSAGGPYALACAAAMPHRVRAVATLAGMAPLECVRHVFELRLWADLLLIPVARLSLRAAAALLWLGRRMPNRYLAWEIRRTAGSRDGALLREQPLQWVIAAYREATVGGVYGTAQDYRRFGGSWGFDLGAVHQSVTVWQGEQDILLPMDHARRLASALPSSTLNVVASSGHYLPAVIADVVLDDLAPR
jgi:pimeloyl-ACP methyl ester carboxylesterase